MAPLLAMAVAVALIALAGPRLVAGIVTGSFDDTVHALGRDEVVSDEAVRLALASRLLALDLIGDGRLHADTAALRYADYLRAPDSHSRDRLDRAIAAHREALDRAPSQPFVWTRLALAETLRGGYQPSVAAALQMSLVTGRYEPRLLIPRLELAFTVWPLLPDALREEFGQQIALAMRWAPRELVAATRHFRRLAAVRDALLGEPELRARFNLLYLRQFVR